MRWFLLPILTGVFATSVAYGQLDAESVPDETVEALIEKVLSEPAPESAMPLLPECTELERRAVSTALIDRRQRIRDSVLTLLDVGEDCDDLLLSLGPKTKTAIAPALVAWLNSDSEKRQSRGLSYLFQFESVPNVVVPQLRALTGERSGTVREKACRVLSWVHPPPTAARPELQRCLKEINSSVQIAAARALLSIDKNDQSAIDTLLKIMRESRVDRRTKAADALAFAGDAILDRPTQLYEAFTTIGAERRIDSIFSACGPQAIPLMLEWLKTPGTPEWVRQEIVQCLGYEREFPVGTRDVLINIAIEEKGQTQWSSLRLLRFLGELDARRLEPLANGSHLDRLELASALGAATKAPKEAQRLLRQLREDEVKPVRAAAFRSLCQLGIVDEAVVSFVNEQLRNGNPRERSEATKMAGNIAQLTDQTIAPLIALLSYDGVVSAGFGGYHVCENAVDPLVQIGAPAVPSLIDALKAKSGETRALAAKALGQIKDPRAFQPLVELLNDTQSRLVFCGCLTSQVQVREEALRALASMDPQTQELMPRLEKLLTQDWSRTLAIRAIGNTGPSADRFVSRFLKAQLTEAPTRQFEIARAVSQLRPTGAIGLIGIKRLLNDAPLEDPMDNDNYTLPETIDLIVELDERSKPLIPTLRHLVEEAELLHAENRAHAAYALAVIDKDPQWKSMLKRWARSQHLFSSTAEARLQQLDSRETP